MALCGGIVLEEALDLSLDRLLNDDDTHTHTKSTPFVSSLSGNLYN
jgi:hypothetical protein